MSSLEILCVAAASAGDFASAFMYADRRCRVLPHAGAHHFALRADALIRMGDRDGAVADICTALELAPDDIQANRRMLSWGTQQQRISAARVLVAVDDDAAVLVAALDVLRGTGCKAVGGARVVGSLITGWAVWAGPAAPSLMVKDGASQESVSLVADPEHPLATSAFAQATAFQVSRAVFASDHTISLSLDRKRFFKLHTPGSAVANRVGVSPSSLAAAEITVIVPVYRDYSATRTCLESLAIEIGRNQAHRAILVDDAAPEPKLKRYLRSFTTKNGFQLLSNETNLGFVGSVNRALGLVPQGDVVLLNADTIVPPRCLERMQSVAQCDATIGTITPLSNNGEFTSFPLPFLPNPLPSREAVIEIDRLAAAVNHDAIVDLPNGIGFCLFVTRRCLDAVGALSPGYARGYLEDVDFCLRARHRGFRNVCAPSIFVGHHGSRSFGAAKRALVVRNVAVTEARFPNYRNECALFMLADPLRPARAAIEQSLRVPARYDRLIVYGSRLASAIATERAMRLSSRGKKALLVCVERVQDKSVLKVRDPAGTVPQSVTYMAEPTDLDCFRAYLRQLLVDAIEIVDPAAISDELIGLLEESGKSIRFVVADAGLLCPRGTLLQPDGRVCTTLGTDAVCHACTASRDETQVPARDSCWRTRWKSRSTAKLVAPSESAKGFIATVLSAPQSLPPPVPVVGTETARRAASRIGIVVQGRSIEEFALMQTFLRGSVRASPQQDFVVIGATADDLALIAVGNTFVTGAVEPRDCAKVLRQYGAERVFLPLRRPLFGHPSFAAAAASGLPRAYFDWSFGGRKPRDGDLPIDPRCSMADVVRVVRRWAGF